MPTQPFFVKNSFSVGNTTVNSIANSSSILPGLVQLNNQVINDNFTIATGINSVIAGPISIQTGKILTVSTGCRLVII